MIKKYNKEKIESLEGIHLLDFYADWCGPCKMLGQVLEQLEDIDIIKINVDEEQELAQKFDVMSIPSLFVIKNGKVVEQSVGAKPKAQILAMVK